MVTHAVIGDIVADPHQRFGHHLSADIALGEGSLRVEPGGVLALLDIDGCCPSDAPAIGRATISLPGRFS